VNNYVNLFSWLYIFRTNLASSFCLKCKSNLWFLKQTIRQYIYIYTSFNNYQRTCDIISFEPLYNNQIPLPIKDLFDPNQFQLSQIIMKNEN
jgi:hypothetical protein